ncbi:hypothetical protein PYW07_013626 [Mythimna separata]|uniref:Uncharacterized protein n=1 Tax=Mythimna separata TaxID=271217 RepID=A0AAD8DQ13_MYTSE|nr:hypothetical protein PYW07_013626 [Mythimna separata]
MGMYVSMCETPCLCTYSCDDDWEWDPSDLINSPFRSPTVTLFYFSLMMSEDGPYYTTDPAQFETNSLREPGIGRDPFKFARKSQSIPLISALAGPVQIASSHWLLCSVDALHFPEARRHSAVVSFILA